MLLTTSSRPGAWLVGFRALFCVSCLGGFTAVAQTQVPGKVPGSLSVSPNGAAIYSIPIAVPQGPAGHEPKLALSYNSQASNGLMGVGWSMEGLSVIGRCPKTLLTDGVRGGVNNNVDDRFCLDGQRLINVSGTYGASASEYRTEIDGFSKVTAQGVAGSNPANGPERFIVRTKSGLTLEYGGTNDSRIEVQGGSSVRLWAVNRITDAMSNTIEFTYAENNALGQYQVSAITYAGRSVQFIYEDRPDKFQGYQAGTRIAQTERLKEVETRIGSVTVQRTKISYAPESSVYGSFASSIQICDKNSNCVTPTKIDYRPIGANQQINLGSVGTTWAFTMEDLSAYQKSQHFVLDYDGDGVSDVVSLLIAPMDSPSCRMVDDCQHNPTPVVYQVRKGLGDGNYSAPVLGTGFGDRRSFNHLYFGLTAGNVNGDLYTDLIGYEIGAGALKTSVALSNGSGFSHGPVQVLGYGYGADWRLMSTDIKGSGRSDLIAYAVGARGVQTQSLISNGSNGFVAQGIQSHSASNYSEWQLSATDFNSDGHTDLLLHHVGAAGVRLQPLLGDGNGNFTLKSQIVLSTANFTGWTLAFMDVNVDRLPDVVVHQVAGGGFNTKAFINRGNATFEDGPGGSFSLGQAPAPLAVWNVVSMDVNADGRDDLVATYFYPAPGFQHRFVFVPFLSGGRGDFVQRATQTLALQQPPSTNGEFSVRNVEAPQALVVNNPGDGLAHILMTTRTAACVGLSAKSCNPVDRLRAHAFVNLDVTKLATRFHDGSSTVEIAHEPLTRSGLHAMDGAQTYPRTNLSMPLQVVSSIARSNGVGGNNSTIYTYGGLKGEHASSQHPGSGRGLLGFRWVKSMESATGLEMLTEFSQNWPTIGQAIRSETRRSGAGNGGVLKQTATKYDCYMSHTVAGGAGLSGPTGACVPWAAGKVYFPFASVSTEDSWDLNGTAMPRIATTSTYGGYAEEGGGSPRQFGDPTQVVVDILEAGVRKHQKLTVNEYLPAKTGGSNWQLGRLKRATVTSRQY